MKPVSAESCDLCAIGTLDQENLDFRATISDDQVCVIGNYEISIIGNVGNYAGPLPRIDIPMKILEPAPEDHPTYN